MFVSGGLRTVGIRQLLCLESISREKRAGVDMLTGPDRLEH